MQHQVVSREQWLAARLGLLKEEKELTRRSDELARRRQELPWVRLAKEYRFQTDEGNASLEDLFKGRSQLLVYHFMFGPDYAAGCASCSAIADGFNGFAVHLANHDVMLWAVSRAPLAKLHAYKKRMGWTFPWASSQGSDFNFDFNVAFTEEQQREGLVEYNYERGGHAMDATPIPEPVAQFTTTRGTDAPAYSRDRPGMSAFALEDGVVYHVYSTYAASKAALHPLTQAARILLAGQHASVVGVYPGPIDTDMSRVLAIPKTAPRDVAVAILDGVEAGQEDIFPDPFAVEFGRSFEASPKTSERQVAVTMSAAAA